MRARIKIDGITRLEDALAAAALGVDALGLVFAPGPRRVDADTAAAIVGALPPFVTAVGVFVDPLDEDVRRTLEAVPLDVLQFHGAEDDAFCESFGRPYLKAIAVSAPVDVGALGASYPHARGFVLDAAVAGRTGGTGERFDWRHWPGHGGARLVLAGGLHPGNVGDALRATGAMAVDVSSGVETDTRGVKDARKIERFITEVARVAEAERAL